MKKLIVALAAIMPLLAAANEARVASPNGQTVVSISDDGGQARYTVTHCDQPLLLPSRLGFRADMGDFTCQLTLGATRQSATDRHYTMRQTKQREAHYQATLLQADFTNATGQTMTVEFSVADHDVAFRYLIPRQKGDNPKSAVIYEEVSSFCLDAATATSFLCPQITPMTGWERTKPSYEEEYTPDAPLATPSKFGQGYTFPCLFRVATPAAPKGGASGSKASASTSGAEGEAWVLISETGVSSQYCASHLSDYHAGEGYTVAFPQAGENNGNGTPFAGVSLPCATPWRTITVGQSLAPIVETTVSYDLVEPLYEAAPGLKPGRYTWSWLVWQDNSINYDDQVQFIDLAAAMGYEYCLVDNWWDTQIGRERMAELSKYAQGKGVSLMLWYNSNGYENDAPQTPRQCMSTAAARDREMAWLQKIGVKGIKVDFFGGDKQQTMELYEDILYDANRYGLQVVFHGCTIPRGWEVMYPNYVSSEAVLASENVFFSDYHAAQEPFQLTMHPFCRNAVGTMDWGGTIMNRYLSRDNKSRHQRMTTDVFEMASGVTNQSLVQCVAVQPNNLSDVPQAELDWLRTLPTEWLETRFVCGYPGRYVVLARKSIRGWTIAGLNATGQPLTLTLQLPMLEPRQTVNVITDDADGRALFATQKLDKRGALKVTMATNGGLIIEP